MKLKKYYKIKIKKIKKFQRNNNGNIFIGITAILLISFLILSVFILNFTIENEKENINSIENDQFEYIIQDYKRNIPIIEKEAIKELSEEVITKKTPLFDSKVEIKKLSNEKLKQLNIEYLKNYNIQINSSLTSIENTSDPFDIRLKTYVSIVKNGKDNNRESSNIKEEKFYENIEENDINIEGLKDPIPFLKCGNDWSFSYNNTTIFYGESLAKYLEDKEIENSSAYINSTTPLIIKKCPYDPYKHHGDANTMKICRDTGYFHESADGACYICRLEGKSGCNHYGFETFINPQSTNKTNLTAACGSDHVIFGENTYPGIECIYYSYNGLNEILFLDKNGHRVKYGMNT